jgi:hypothetical protein
VIAGSVSESEGTLTAGPEGTTYRLRGGFELWLERNASFKFERPTKLQLSANGFTPTQVLGLRSGRVEVQSPREGPLSQAVMVTAPLKVMGVFSKGDGAVLVSGQRVTVTAERGKVLVGVDNDWRPLSEGYSRTITGQDHAGKPRPILPAPTLRLPSALILSADRGVSPAGVAWTPVPGAAAYEVALVGSNGKYRRSKTHEPQAELGGLEPGTHRLAIRAIDTQGLPGRGSRPQQIRVVQAMLPPGAYMGADGALRLETAHRVRLLGTEGLEMTVGAGERFVRIPESVALYRNQETRIRLREPSGGNEAMLVLIPQVDRASITFDPVPPRWPQEEVTMNVDLYDGHNQPVRPEVNAPLEVRVNRQKLAPPWRRQGGRRTASVKPSSPLGPWVLTVRVVRPNGDVVASGSLRVGER